MQISSLKLSSTWLLWIDSSHIIIWLEGQLPQKLTFSSDFIVDTTILESMHQLQTVGKNI